nr:hypothetical protein [Ruminococcus sp.]
SFGLFDDNAVYSEYLVSEQYLKYLGTISKKYFVIREELSNKIQNDIINAFPEKKVLGVHFRGTDFNAGRHGHPVIGKLTQYYNAIDEALRQGYNSIFLATDDKKVLSSFIEKYGDKICYFKDVKRSTSECGVHLQNHQEGCSGYYLGREVLRDMVALTCCDGLVAGLSQVSIFARIQKYANESHYNYLKIIDNGIHQNDSAKAKEYYGKLYQSNVIK